MGRIQDTKKQIFFERYRPETLEDYICTPSFRTKMEHFIEGNFQHMILESVSPGTGKSTLVKILAKEMGATPLWINARLESGIETIRDTVREFISKRAIGLKFVIFDEGDNLTKDAQECLKGFLEDFGKNRSTRFIFTCNHINKLNPAIRSRCISINFNNILMEDKKLILQGFYNLCVRICTENDIKFKKKALAMLVKKYFPDFRALIVFLQDCSTNNQVIDVAALEQLESNLKEVLSATKNGNFKIVRKFIENNVQDSSRILTELYDNMGEYFIPDTKTSMGVLAISDAQLKLAFAMDARIPLFELFVKLGQAGCIR